MQEPDPPSSQARERAEIVVDGYGTVTRASARARELLGLDDDLEVPLREVLQGFPFTMWRTCGVGAVVSVRCKRADVIVEVVHIGPDDLTLVIAARGEAHPIDAHLDAVSRVVTELAHEVNNALTGIVAALDSTIEFEEISPGARTLLASAHSEVLRVGKIVSQARYQSRRGEPNIEAIEIRRELDSVLRPLHAFFERRKISTVIEIPDDLAVIHSDPSWLLSILVNLLFNARDALTTFGSVLNVRLDRLPGDVDGGRPWLALTVRDDGIGMKREDLLRAGDFLFTTKKYGTGIGLATVRAMAASLSGSLLLRSTPGRGTIATVFFVDPR